MFMDTLCNKTTLFRICFGEIVMITDGLIVVTSFCNLACKKTKTLYYGSFAF